VSALVSPEKISAIEAIIRKHPEHGLKDWKGLLDPSISYSDIRAVSTWVKKSEAV